MRVVSKKPIWSFDELKTFVYETVCSDQNLLMDLSRTSESTWKRRGEICGVMFSFRGPRAVIFDVIWDTQHDHLLFYGVNGRYKTIMLTDVEVLSPFQS